MESQLFAARVAVVYIKYSILFDILYTYCVCVCVCASVWFMVFINIDSPMEVQDGVGLLQSFFVGFPLFRVGLLTFAFDPKSSPTIFRGVQS